MTYFLRFAPWIGSAYLANWKNLEMTWRRSGNSSTLRTPQRWKTASNRTWKPFSTIWSGTIVRMSSKSSLDSMESSRRVSHFLSIGPEKWFRPRKILCYIRKYDFYVAISSCHGNLGAHDVQMTTSSWWIFQVEKSIFPSVCLCARVCFLKMIKIVGLWIVK